MGADAAEVLRSAVESCRERGSTIGIRGHGSKAALGDIGGAETLSTLDHAGILDYRPEELVVTARAGTPLAELQAALAEKGQMLPFDPPRFGGKGTFGGAIASGLSGPARPWRGSVRDAVLGVEIVNGLGERLRFGGSVMKNVAGYDVSRMMTGARGRLGVVLSASVRVAPVPEAEETWRISCDGDEAAMRYRRWSLLSLPISATCWFGGTLNVRLSGSAAGIAQARRTMGFDTPGDDALWASVRDHRHDFLDGATAMTRLSLPRGSGFENEDALVEWGGCQAWLRGRVAPPPGAFATAFHMRPDHKQTDQEPTNVSDSLGAPTRAASEAIAKYEARLRLAFDPDGVFAPAT